MLRTTLLTSALLLAPGLALAAGGMSTTPPTTTSTTTECEEGQIYDTTTETCMDAKESRFNDADRYEATRELAYAGAYDRAMDVLDSFQNENDDRRLTYMGFVTRKMGDMEGGMSWYQAALAQNPDNILARSYMGQAYVIQGNATAAEAQLREIRARGGRETWAELALEMALRDGPAPSY